MKNELFTDVDISAVTDEFKNQGVPEDVIKVAEEDLEKGISRNKVSLYAAVKDIERVTYMSEAFGMGASENLVKRFSYIDKDKIELAISEIKNFIPEDVIIKIITKKIGTEEMIQMFEKYMELYPKTAVEEESDSEYSEDDIEMIMERLCILEDKVEVIDSTLAEISSGAGETLKINETIPAEKTEKNKEEKKPFNISEPIPIIIETKHKKSQSGVAALASKLFSGSPYQESLMNLLIQGRLDKNQLGVIKKAREADFSDAELKDLIESGLPAEEMAGIIDVVIAEKSRMKTNDNG